MPAVDVLLVRHGESTWNAEGRWQGQADPPLTDRGRQQARHSAAGLPLPVTALVASDLERARVTAQLMGQEVGCGPVVVDEGFRERDAGAFSGLTRVEIHERFPGLLPDDPTRIADARDTGLIAPPGWELDDHLSERAWAALDRLVARLHGGGTGVVVTHSGLIYAVERDLGLDRTRVANLEGRWLRHDGTIWTAGPRLLLLDPARDTITSPDQL